MASEKTPLKLPRDIEGGFASNIIAKAAGSAYREYLRFFARSSTGAIFWIVLYIDSLLLFFVMAFRLFQNPAIITPIAISHLVLSVLALSEPIGLSLGGASMDMLLNLRLLLVVEFSLLVSQVAISALLVGDAISRFEPGENLEFVSYLLINLRLLIHPFATGRLRTLVQRHLRRPARVTRQIELLRIVHRQLDGEIRLKMEQFVRSLPTADDGAVEEAAVKGFNQRLRVAQNRSNSDMLGSKGDRDKDTPNPPGMEPLEPLQGTGTAEPSTSALASAKFLMIEMPRQLPLVWGTAITLQLVLGTNIALASYLIKWIVEALMPFDSAYDDPSGGKNYGPVVQAFAVYAGVSLALPLNGLFFAYASSRLIAGMESNLRRRLTQHIMSRGTQFFADRSVGELNAAFSTDIPMITVAVEFWWKTAGTQIIGAVVSVILIGTLNMRACILFLGSLPILFTAGPMDMANTKALAWTESTGTTVGEFMNLLDVHRVTRALDAYGFVYGRFVVHMDEYEQALQQNTLYQFLVFITQLNMTRAFQVLLLICVAIEVIMGNLSIAGYVAIAQMVVLACNAMAPNMAGFQAQVIRASGAVAHVRSILSDERNEALDSGGPAERDLGSKLPLLEHEMRLRDVCFRYAPPPVPRSVDSVSATFPYGSYVVLCGGSGSGKSTLLNVLLQFRRAESGAIEFDGVDTLSVGPIEDFKAQVGVVFQETMLLDGTVRENIAYGFAGATDADVEQAARRAEVHDVVTTLLPHGYATTIGAGADATSMSGGQMQRICLARALMRKPRLLLLDEATSALDPKTEAGIVRTLENLTVNNDDLSSRCTVVSVSHRMGTAHNASHVLVLERGQMVALGTYNNFMEQRNPAFMRLLGESP